MKKFQAPSSKLQRNLNLQAPNANPKRAARFSKLGYWCFSGVWMLVLGAFPVSAIDGPLTPEDSLRHLKTEPGLRVELVASEPMVVDPVAVAWDERGRMFVVEDRGYPTGPGKGKLPLGQVVLLEDSDGDGKYDTRTVFVEGLTFPNGVMPWDGGVYVTCAPNLFYFKDTDGDGRADVKKVVFKGFQDLSTTQLRVSHPTLAIDNWVYLTSGLTAAKVISPAHTNREPVFLNRVDGRFRPGTDDIEPTSGTAQFGQTFDAFGRRFICSNRNHIQHVVMQQRYQERNPRLNFSQVVEDIPDHGGACRLYPLSANIVTAASHGGYVTSACGVTIYNGTALPDSYRGNSFTCEPAGNLVHHDVLEPKGVTFVAKRAYPTNEFLASPDNWFRPVNLAVGPDGALYVCDMYRKTIEHPEYLPEATRKVTDFESGKGMGRIYRVVAETPNTKTQTPKKFQTANAKKFDLGKATVKELCAQFENPNIWWRMTAQRLLLERHDSNAVPSLEELVRNGRSPEARVHAAHTLEGLGALTDETISKLMRDDFPAVREHGIQLAEPRLAKSGRLDVQQLDEDPDPRVRFYCALALGVDFWDGESRAMSLLRIVNRDMDDKWTRAAVLSSVPGTQCAYEMLGWISSNRRNQAADGQTLMIEELSKYLAAEAKREDLILVLNMVLWPRPDKTTIQKIAMVNGFVEGLRFHKDFGTGPALMKLIAEDSHRLKRQADEALTGWLIRSGPLSTNLAAEVTKLLGEARGLALDTKQPIGSRLAAISMLGQADTTGRALEDLIEPQQPPEIQTAAIRALGQIARPDAGAVFVKRERWNAYTPAVRDAALTVLTGNPDLLRALFTAIEAGDVPAWTVNADRRNQLMKHKDEAIKSHAEKLFKDLTPGDRMKVYENSKSALTFTGNGKNGHTLFQKNCAPCHTFSGEGHLVGPDLTGIRNQPAEVILLHIIVPEYEIMPVYTSYNVETKGGDAYTGLLAAETPGSITLRMAQSIDQQIPRTDIASMTTSRLSLMPQEFEKTMTKQELADLLAFLKGQ